MSHSRHLPLLLCALLVLTRAAAAQFVYAYRRALSRAVRAGWILQRDAKLMRKWAAGSDVGR